MKKKRVTPLAKAWERCLELRRAVKQYALVCALDCLRVFSFQRWSHEKLFDLSRFSKSLQAWLIMAVQLRSKQLARQYAVTQSGWGSESQSQR